MSITSQVPDAGTPIFDDRGYINPVWHEFFFNLLRRTGGTVGVDAGTQEGRIDTLERRTVEIEAYEYSNVPNFKSVSQIDLGFAPSHGVQYDPLHHAIASATDNGFMSSADKAKLDGVTPGATVASVGGTAPIVSSGGASPVISISPATIGTAGSLSASDKTKLDSMSSGAAVASVSGTAPIDSSGGATPVISITAATTVAAGSMSAADKTIVDALSVVGTWTPTLSFATPGNLAVTYSTQTGHYVKSGKMVALTFTIITSAFTHTTAAGNLVVSGFPFTLSGPPRMSGALDFQGITMAGYTSFSLVAVPGSSIGQVVAYGSGQPRANATITNAPTGSSMFLSGTLIIFV